MNVEHILLQEALKWTAHLRKIVSKWQRIKCMLHTICT